MTENFHEIRIPLDKYIPVPVPLTEAERATRAACCCGGVARMVKAWTVMIGGREYRMFRLGCNRCDGFGNVRPRKPRFGLGGRRKRAQRRSRA